MLTERLRESIRLRFVLVFMGTLLLTGICTFPTILISEAQRVMTEIETQLGEQAVRIEALDRKTDLAAQEIAELVQSSSTVIEVYDDIGVLQQVEQDVPELKGGEVVLLDWYVGSYPRLVVRCGDDYYRLIPNMRDNQFQDLRDVTFRVLWTCMLLGVLLLLPAIQTITEPVRRLNAATKRVAQGDFDVTISEATRDELGQLTRNFNRMTHQLRQMETMRSDFVSSISHEFKTPLASIQGFARLLQKKNLPQQQVEEYTQVILEESTRLTNLSSNILRLNALENQSIPHKPSEFSLDEQIRRSVLMLASQWEPKEIEFDLDLDEMDYYGDQDLLQQVWMNLVGNAVKFSEKGGDIHLTLKEEAAGVLFTCRDEGMGIEPEAQQRIFEKFYQADRSRAREGNGLGLAIVQRILTLCGGSIDFTSEPGKGTTFRVMLPAPERPPQPQTEEMIPDAEIVVENEEKKEKENDHEA